MITKNTITKTVSLRFFLILSFSFLSACVLSQGKTNAKPAQTTQQASEVKPQECPVQGKEKSCAQCHTLTKEDAERIFSIQGPKTIKILKITDSPINGLWEVFFHFKGGLTIAYIDYSKKYFISGAIIDHEKRENLTNTRMQDLSRVDVKRIPQNDALLIGKKSARHKVFIFDDPDCGYCKKLHDELKKVVDKNPNIAFYIRLLPLEMHKEAYAKSIAIVCERSKSLQMLEDNFAGKPIPQTKCNTTEIDDNIKLAKEFGITGTPTIVLPNGIIMPGYKEADALIKIVLENAQ